MAIAGLDHVVIAVHDLDHAAAEWRSLGFTVSPRGVHSAHMGTINHTVMLGPDYLELLAVAQPTDGNQATREFLARGEGIERLALRSTDAASDAQALRDRGIAASGPVSFSRPVSRGDGGEAEAAFRVYYWPADARVAGMRLFACEHRTPEAVWLPELQHHSNGASRVLRIECVVDEPEADASTMGGLLGIEAIEIRDGSAGPSHWRLSTARERAGIDFIGPASDRSAGTARLVLASADPAVQARPAWRGNGIELTFEPDPMDQ